MLCHVYVYVMLGLYYVIICLGDLSVYQNCDVTLDLLWSCCGISVVFSSSVQLNELYLSLRGNRDGSHKCTHIETKKHIKHKLKINSGKVLTALQ